MPMSPESDDAWRRDFRIHTVLYIYTHTQRERIFELD